MRVLFLKAHNPGYTRKDGVKVAPFDDKRPPAKTKIKRSVVSRKDDPHTGDMWDANPKARGVGKPDVYAAIRESAKSKKTALPREKFENLTGSLVDGNGVAVGAPKKEMDTHKTPLEYRRWSDTRAGARVVDVGDVLSRKDGYIVVVSAEIPFYIAEEGLSFGGKGDSGYMQYYKAVPMTNVPKNNTKANAQDRLQELFGVANKGDVIDYYSKSKPVDLGRQVGFYSMPGRPGSRAATPSLVIYENGIMASTPIYDDFPIARWVPDKALAKEANEALEDHKKGIGGKSKEQQYADLLSTRADEMLKEMGVRRPEKSINNKWRERNEKKPAASASSGKKPKPAVSAKSGATKLYISGNTYEHKDKIKSLGGRWDADKKSWWVPISDADELRRKLSGRGLTFLEKSFGFAIKFD